MIVQTDIHIFIRTGKASISFVSIVLFKSCIVIAFGHLKINLRLKIDMNNKYMNDCVSI